MKASLFAISTLLSLSHAQQQPQQQKFVVTVGGPGGNKFVPDTITASPNDLITFDFPEAIHNMIETNLKGGCSPLIGGARYPITDKATAGSFFPFTVPRRANRTALYFYCAPHCASDNMKFTINFAPGSDFIPTFTLPAATPASTSAIKPPTTYLVTVGGVGNTFSPPDTTVKPGDVVTFKFNAATHNVFQGDKKGGCDLLAGGFQFPKDGSLAEKDTTWNFTVPEPGGRRQLWFFCKPHCGAGMTGSLAYLGAPPASTSSGAQLSALVALVVISLFI